MYYNFIDEDGEKFFLLPYVVQEGTNMYLITVALLRRDYTLLNFANEDNLGSKEWRKIELWTGLHLSASYIKLSKRDLTATGRAALRRRKGEDVGKGRA